MSQANSGSSLPARPSLEFLRKLAKDRLRSLRESKPETRLFESQLAVAREHGFASWRAMVASIRQSNESNVLENSDRVWIDGIDKLGWGKWGPTTYVGAMASALKAAGPAHSYTTLMGDSGLAFRSRWWTSDDGSASCPSAPVGEFSPWTDLLEASVGWKMRWDVRLESPTDEREQHATELKDDIVDSIDSGLPVLCYPTQLDMGLIYGYEQGGEWLLVSDYYVGEKDALVELRKTRGLFAFFETRTTVPDRKSSALRGIANALQTWSSPSSFAQRQKKPGQYYTGPAAFEKWIDRLAHAGAMTEPQQRNLFHVSYWVFIILHEARQQAAAYLGQVRPLFDPAASDALAEAAAIYDDIGRRTAMVIHESKRFMPFYMPEMFARWNDAVRKEEIEIVESIARDEAKAIAHLARAAR